MIKFYSGKYACWHLFLRQNIDMKSHVFKCTHCNIAIMCTTNWCSVLEFLNIPVCLSALEPNGFSNWKDMTLPLIFLSTYSWVSLTLMSSLLGFLPAFSQVWMSKPILCIENHSHSYLGICVSMAPDYKIL